MSFCVYVHVCTYVCMCVQVETSSLSQMLLLRYYPPCVLRQSLILVWNSPVRLDGPRLQAPRIHLSLTHQYWNYKSMPRHLASLRGFCGSNSSLCLNKRILLSELLPLLYCKCGVLLQYLLKKFSCKEQDFTDSKSGPGLIKHSCSIYNGSIANLTTHPEELMHLAFCQSWSLQGLCSQYGLWVSSGLTWSIIPFNE